MNYGRTTGDSDFSLGFEKWREVKMGVEMVRNGWLGDYIIVCGLNGFFFFSVKSINITMNLEFEIY